MLNFAFFDTKKKKRKLQVNDPNKKFLGQNITGGKGRIAYFLKAFGAKKNARIKNVVSLFY